MKSPADDPRRQAAIDQGAAALLRDRVGYLAASANDETIAQAKHDATVVLEAMLTDAHVALPRGDSRQADGGAQR